MLTASSSGSYTVNDAVYDTYTSAVVRQDNQITAGTAVTYTSTDTAAATVDSSGYVTSEVRLGRNGRRLDSAQSSECVENLDVTVSLTGGVSSTTFSNYVSGTLARAVTDNINSLISGLTTDNQPMFSTRDDTDGIYVRNSIVWTGSVDLSPISPWNACP